MLSVLADAIRAATKIVKSRISLRFLPELVSLPPPTHALDTLVLHVDSLGPVETDNLLLGFSTSRDQIQRSTCYDVQDVIPKRACRSEV